MFVTRSEHGREIPNDIGFLVGELGQHRVWRAGQLRAGGDGAPAAEGGAAAGEAGVPGGAAPRHYGHHDATTPRNQW